MRKKIKIPSLILNVSIAMTAVLSLGSFSASAVETPFIPYDESEYENTTVNWEDFYLRRRRRKQRRIRGYPPFHSRR